MASLLRSEELRTYLRWNMEYIVNHVNERFDESENEIITTFFLELLRYFTIQYNTIKYNTIQYTLFNEGEHINLLQFSNIWPSK